MLFVTEPDAEVLGKGADLCEDKEFAFTFCLVAVLVIEEVLTRDGLAEDNVACLALLLLDTPLLEVLCLSFEL